MCRNLDLFHSLMSFIWQLYTRCLFFSWMLGAHQNSLSITEAMYKRLNSFKRRMFPSNDHGIDSSSSDVGNIWVNEFDILPGELHWWFELGWWDSVSFLTPCEKWWAEDGAASSCLREGVFCCWFFPIYPNFSYSNENA